MSKSNKNRDRREQVEQMRRQAQAAERRRTLAVVAGCVVVALIIVGIAGYSILQDRREKEALKKQSLTEIGAKAPSAGCTPIKEVAASGQGEHTTDRVDYTVQPPSFGAHNPSAAEGGIHMYATDDRPQVEQLVHNLEHGWTIVWYDDSVASDDSQMQVLEATATKFDAEGDDPRSNMIIAPWTSDDGSAIPGGKHIALTHWSIHQPTYKPPTSNASPPSFGESLYCDRFSGDALDSFMKKYPYDDAPEGYLWHQGG
jgi:hypothetical protein